MPVTCPFCRSDRSQLISLFGSQLLFSQYRCTTCGSYFEGLREDRDDLQETTTSSDGDDHGSRTDKH